MTRKSKYEGLVNNTFEIEYKGVEYQVDVIDTDMIEKVSKKTGRSYKVRRIWVCLSGSANEFEIGTQSWNKKSFMKNLLKAEGVEHLVQSNDEEDTVAEPNFYFCGGKMYGDISVLIDFGHKCGLYQSYCNKYTYESIKQDFEIMYKRACETKDFIRAINELKDFKIELRQAMHTVIDFEDLSEVRGIEINATNLKKYVEAYMLDMNSYRLEKLINGLVKNLEMKMVQLIFNSGTIPFYSRFGFNECSSEREVKKLYRKLSKELHPDLGGDQNKFIEMKSEYNSAMNRFA